MNELKPCPSESEKQRAMKIRRATKQGQYVAPADMEFITYIYDRFPEWYSETEQQIFEETKPFGAR